MNIRFEIQEKLLQTEQQENVKIPIAVESGSRGWGFASPDSDYDCRFVYVRSKEDYLTIFNQRDTISYTPDKVFDLDGWDIKKVLQHILKSNAVMHEWLSSPQRYRQNTAIWQLLWDLSREYFNPIAAGYHYLNMAKGQYKDLLKTDTFKLKGYFYILRPLVAARYIMEAGEIPHMEFQRNVAAVHLDTAVRNAIQQLLDEKETACESEKIERHPVLVPWAQQEIETTAQWLSSQTHRKVVDYRAVDDIFRKIIELAWQDE